MPNRISASVQLITLHSSLFINMIPIDSKITDFSLCLFDKMFKPICSNFYFLKTAQKGLMQVIRVLIMLQGVISSNSNIPMKEIATLCIYKHIGLPSITECIICIYCFFFHGSDSSRYVKLLPIYIYIYIYSNNQSNFWCYTNNMVQNKQHSIIYD